MTIMHGFSYPLNNNAIDFTQNNDAIVHILTWYNVYNASPTFVTVFCALILKGKVLLPWGLQHQFSVVQELKCSGTQTLGLFYFLVFHLPGQKSTENDVN